MYNPACIIAVLTFLTLTTNAYHQAYTSIWTIQLRSHPYKTQLYTAEFVMGAYRYLWCADLIHKKDAVVLCNQESTWNGLGPYDLTSTIEFGPLRYDTTDPQFFTNQTFACVGNETRLSDCPLVPVTERCPSGNVGQVDCHPADNARKNLTTSLITLPHIDDMGVVKLENPALDGMTGMICIEDGSWSDTEASVVCKSLGYDMGWAVDAFVVANVSSLHPSFVIKDPVCTGNESSINSCAHKDMCQSIDFLSKNFMCPGMCNGDIAAVVCV